MFKKGGMEKVVSFVNNPGGTIFSEVGSAIGGLFGPGTPAAPATSSSSGGNSGSAKNEPPKTPPEPTKYRYNG